MIHHIEYFLFLEVKSFNVGLLKSFSKSVPPQGFYTEVRETGLEVDFQKSFWLRSRFPFWTRFQ